MWLEDGLLYSFAKKFQMACLTRLKKKLKKKRYYHVHFLNTLSKTCIGDFHQCSSVNISENHWVPVFIGIKINDAAPSVMIQRALNK